MKILIKFIAEGVLFTGKKKNHAGSGQSRIRSFYPSAFLFPFPLAIRVSRELSQRALSSPLHDRGKKSKKDKNIKRRNLISIGPFLLTWREKRG